MDAAAFVQALAEKGVVLWVTPEGGLGFEAPKGIVTQKVRANLTAAKPRLIPYLQSVGASPPPKHKPGELAKAPTPKTPLPVATIEVPDELPDIEPEPIPDTEPAFVTRLLSSSYAQSVQAWKGTLPGDGFYTFLMLSMHAAATFGVLPTLPDDAPLTLRPGTTVTNISKFVCRAVARSRDMRGKLREPRIMEETRAAFLDELAIIALDLDTVAAHLSGWKHGVL